MADLSDFKNSRFVSVRMAGASVTKTAEYFGVANRTVPKSMTAFEKEGKNLLTEPKFWKKAKGAC